MAGAWTWTRKYTTTWAAAYNNRGISYYNKRDYNRAIADYETALRIDPNYTNAKNNLENARRARGWQERIRPPPYGGGKFI
jgi:tetratricopeptide (TPR) repeat protein